LCCVCFYFVALDVSLGFHFLLYVCYVNPAYGCQTEINCVCADEYANAGGRRRRRRRTVGRGGEITPRCGSLPCGTVR